MKLIDAILSFFQPLEDREINEVKTILTSRIKYVLEFHLGEIQNFDYNIEESKLEFPLSVEYLLLLMINIQQSLVLKLSRDNKWREYIQPKDFSSKKQKLTPQLILRKEKELWKLASRLGTEVGFVPCIREDDSSAVFGRYYSEANLILLREGMDYEQYISYFRHELVHALQYQKGISIWKGNAQEIFIEYKNIVAESFPEGFIENVLNYRAKNPVYSGNPSLELPAYFYMQESNWKYFQLLASNCL